MTDATEQGTPEPCAMCAQKDAVIAALQQAVAARQPCTPSSLFNRIAAAQPRPETVYDRCGCNPRNGGSGICGCINGAMEIRS